MTSPLNSPTLLLLFLKGYSMTVMDITIHSTILPHDDPDASLAFYRDTLGFEVRNDVGYGGMRWTSANVSRTGVAPPRPTPPIR
jgi:hypothetical protein